MIKRKETLAELVARIVLAARKKRLAREEHQAGLDKAA
jgi:hypothetical protein